LSVNKTKKRQYAFCPRIPQAFEWEIKYLDCDLKSCEEGDLV